jgi:hypothetical protein
MQIVNDNPLVINKLETSLTDDTRVVIYDRHMFIVQATDYKMTIWKNDPMMEWLFDEMIVWWNDVLAKWSVDKMMKWWIDKMIFHCGTYKVNLIRNILIPFFLSPPLFWKKEAEVKLRVPKIHFQNLPFSGIKGYFSLLHFVENKR